jgi:hypothetical protein
VRPSSAHASLICHCGAHPNSPAGIHHQYRTAGRGSPSPRHMHTRKSGFLAAAAALGAVARRNSCMVHSEVSGPQHQIRRVATARSKSGVCRHEKHHRFRDDSTWVDQPRHVGCHWCITAGVQDRNGHNSRCSLVRPSANARHRVTTYSISFKMVTDLWLPTSEDVEACPLTWGVRLRVPFEALKQNDVRLTENRKQSNSKVVVSTL